MKEIAARERVAASVRIAEVGVERERRRIHAGDREHVIGRPAGAQPARCVAGRRADPRSRRQADRSRFIEPPFDVDGGVACTAGRGRRAIAGGTERDPGRAQDDVEFRQRSVRKLRAELVGALAAIARPGVAELELELSHALGAGILADQRMRRDRKSTRLNSSHEWISYAVFCLKKKKKKNIEIFHEKKKKKKKKIKKKKKKK